MPLSELKGKYCDIKLWAKLSEVEAEAQKQLFNTASMPWVKYIAAMADIHTGYGVPVGSVVALKGAVAPMIVGSDIGCGMVALRTSLTQDDLPKDLAPLRLAIEAAIPNGTGCAHKVPVERQDYCTEQEWKELWEGVEGAKKGKCTIESAKLQLGTLGSGNHFLECSIDTKGQIWFMLHSGSRNLGKEVAEGYTKRAGSLEHNQDLPDKQLSVFLEGSDDYNNYMRDLQVAQRYAKLNRTVMMGLMTDTVRKEIKKFDTDFSVNCHHNYAVYEEHNGEKLVVSRKGAISAKKGELGLIPGAMGRKSFVVEGLGNPESLMSASHGAGRIMSRGAASKKFHGMTEEELRLEVKGTECYLGKGVLDEMPGAYKNILEVMKNQADLVKPLHEIRALITVKGHSDTRRQDRKERKKAQDLERQESRDFKDSLKY